MNFFVWARLFLVNNMKYVFVFLNGVWYK